MQPGARDLGGLIRPHVRRSPGPLNEHELEQFWEQGWVAKELFAPEELQPSIDAINQLVDDLARMLHQSGQISELYQDEPFETRLIKIEKEAPNASVWLHKQPFEMPAAFQDLWSNTRLLDVAQQLIGPKIAGHPVEPRWDMGADTCDRRCGT